MNTVSAQPQVGQEVSEPVAEMQSTSGKTVVSRLGGTPLRSGR